jgi:two-component system phosphate regulon response regulator PhoB
MHAALASSRECEFLIPDDATVSEGEWVLAIFEVEGGRATAAAAKAATGSAGVCLRFEPRDWQRLREFSAAQLAPATDHAPSPPSDAQFDEEPPTTRPSAIMSMQQAIQGRLTSILVVDADAETPEMVSVMLEAVGLQVETVPSGEQALEALRRRAFGLVLTDWNLPGMSGLELCQRLRRDQRWALLPVLFLTGNNAHQDMMQAFAAGADDYVVKPFRASELGARIFALLRRARLTASVT